jgi:hypothetical protein
MVSQAFLFLLTLFLATNAAPLQAGQAGQPNNNGPTPTLSNEVIIGLVSLFVAVFGISITLVASPKMRRNIKSELLSFIRLSRLWLIWYGDCITRKRRHSMEQLRQQYNEFQEFRAYVAMRAM